MVQSRSIPRPLVRVNQWFIVICVVLTWFTNQYWLLALPLLAGILGVGVGFNPVMRAAKLFLRKPVSEYVPEDFDQQQFNQIIASTCLALGLLSYILHWKVMAYVFTAMVSLAAFVAILGFCVGCFIRYQWTQYRHKRASRVS